MKTRYYTLIAAVGLGVLVWASAARGQDSTAVESETSAQSQTSAKAGNVASADSDVSFESNTQVEVNLENVLNPILRPSDRLIRRAIANVDRLPEDLQADVEALQASIVSLKAKWQDEYKPGEDATVDEIVAAREEFRTDLAAEIEANKELRIQVVSELRSDIREKVGDEEWSLEARALYLQYKRIQVSLKQSWRAVLATLGGDATREDVAEAKRIFLDSNAELIAQQKELALEIRTMIRANRDNDGPVVDREPLPPALAELRAEMQIARNDLRILRADARAELGAIAPEEREVHRAEILEELRDAHDDIKDRRRQLIEDLRGEQDGDRRAED